MKTLLYNKDDQGLLFIITSFHRFIRGLRRARGRRYRSCRIGGYKGGQQNGAHGINANMFNNAHCRVRRKVSRVVNGQDGGTYRHATSGGAGDRVRRITFGNRFFRFLGGLFRGISPPWWFVGWLLRGLDGGADSWPLFSFLRATSRRVTCFKCYGGNIFVTFLGSIFGLYGLGSICGGVGNNGTFIFVVTFYFGFYCTITRFFEGHDACFVDINYCCRNDFNFVGPFGGRVGEFCAYTVYSC